MYERYPLRPLAVVLTWFAIGTVILAAPNRGEAEAGEAVAMAETFAREVIGDGCELVNLRGEAPGVAEWSGEGGREGGVMRLLEGELRSPLIPVAIGEKPAPSNGGVWLEPGIYRATVRVRAHGTPERRHCQYAGQGPHHGIVHLRFYDGGGRTAPGSWFSRVIGPGEWHEVSFTAMAPQWTRQARVAVIAHPGCSIEIDTLAFGLDHEALAAFDRDEPTILYRPEAERWRHLPRTLSALREGRPWRVVVLGDSIANDLYHSFFHRRVNAIYPGAEMQLVQSVHGSAGWDYFLQAGDDGAEDRVRSFVLDHAPDLVVIAGMSNREVADLRELARRIRAGGEAEILAVTAAVCQAHYRDSLSPPPEGTSYPVSGRSPLRAAMAEAGQADGFAVFDLGRTWDAFLWNETRPLEWYTRDTSHLNPRGMAVVGRIMAGFFQPLDYAGPAAPVAIVSSAASPAPGSATEDGTGHQVGRGMAAAPEMPVVADVSAKVVRVSPLPVLERIAPYADAFRAVEYSVERRFEGEVREGGRIVVIQQTLKDRKPTVAAGFAPHDRHRLKLGLWERYPEHETWPVSDELELYDARLYYAIEALPMQ